MRLHKRPLTTGFTLVELMIASLIGVLTATVAGQVMLNHLETSERVEAYQRQRGNWTRAAGFIEAEVALSESIVTDPSKVTIPPSCETIINDPQTQFRFALNLRQDVYQSIYAVRPSDEGWLKHNSLWRCGPSFDSQGDYLSIEEEDANKTSGEPKGPGVQRLLVSLDNTEETDHGFRVITPPTNGKLLSFELAMVLLNRDNTTRRFSYKNISSTRTRISPLYSRPTSGSLCMASNMVKFSPNSSQKETGNFSVNISEGDLTPGQDVLICGKGLVSSIYGSSYDDIIESGAETRTTIYGCNGNDVLEGTTANDTLEGDAGASTSCPGDDPSDGDDILIGNGNTESSPEVLKGGDGYNRYVPGTGNVTITGGNNLDVVFFDKPLIDGAKTNYIVPSPDECTRSSCTVTDKTSSDTSVTYTMNMTGIEILIFPDQRKDLP